MLCSAYAYFAFCVLEIRFDAERMTRPVHKHAASVIEAGHMTDFARSRVDSHGADQYREAPDISICFDGADTR